MSKRIDSASRFIPAAPDAIYAAFAEPKAMERWISPKNMSATMLRFDFREGGSYRIRLTYNDAADGQGKTTGNADEVEVRLIKLLKGRQIDEEVLFESNEPAFSGIMRMTWVLDPVDSGTLVTIRAEDVPTGIQPEDHIAGMNSTLENLSSFVSNVST